MIAVLIVQLILGLFFIAIALSTLEKVLPMVPRWEQIVIGAILVIGLVVGVLGGMGKIKLPIPEKAKVVFKKYSWIAVLVCCAAIIIINLTGAK